MKNDHLESVRVHQVFGMNRAGEMTCQLLCDNDWNTLTFLFKLKNSSQELCAVSQI